MIKIIKNVLIMYINPLLHAQLPNRFFLFFICFFGLLSDPDGKKSILYPSLLWTIFGDTEKKSAFHLSSSKLRN